MGLLPAPRARFTDSELDHLEAESAKHAMASDWEKLVASRGERYRGVKFSNFDTRAISSLEAAHASVYAFAVDLAPSVASGRNLVLYGPVGTGKDHLLFAALRGAVFHRIGARWIDGPGMFGAFKEAMDRDSKDTEESILRRLAAPQILAISDPAPPGAAAPTSWEHKIIYRVVEARYSAQRPIWVTVNAQNRADLEAKIGVQVADRLLHDALCVPMVAPSYRRGGK